MLVVAGTDFTDDYGNAEYHVEGENRWEWIPQPMGTARRSPFVALLPSGQVLIAGGDQAGTPLGETEIFDPATQEFRAIGALIPQFLTCP